MHSLKDCFCLKKTGHLPEAYDTLASETCFNVNEVEALFILFKKLSRSIIDDGLIHKEEFLHALFSCSHKQNFFADRLKDMVMAILNESELTLSDDAIEVIVHKTIQEADLKGDGRIDPDEWKELITRYPSLIKIMTLPYLEETTVLFPCFVMTSKVRNSELVYEN